MSNYTTIKISKDFAKMIRTKRKYRRETYEDTLRRGLSKMENEYREVLNI